MLEDFGLTTSDFYGSASDSGGDVKYMLSSALNLKWEWCFAHMTHAATKMSCGVNGKKSREANPDMAELITKMTRVITQVKLVSTAGDLFSELCKSKTKGASTRLLGYSTSRFLSMTNAMKSVLAKWPAIVSWYEERGRQAVRDRKPPPDFPLESHHTDLVHVLSILTPIADIKFKCQAERAEQVEVLMSLYMSRIDELGHDQPVPHYLSTEKKPEWISASSLTPLASKTRDLLRDSLDEPFFSRYYTDSKFDTCDFALEMMLKLHPIYKDTQESLNRAVVMCCRQHGKTGRDAVERLREVNAKISSNLLSLLKSVAEPLEAAEEQADSSVARLSRLEARFAPRADRPATTSRVDRRAEDELDRWLEDPIGVQRNADMTPKESVLQFWKRLEGSGECRLIPKAVRV
ncbi:unnamed protein product [Phytophthora fragariaefolia]|uniref:Unnamed protein product n=1 Tax=Phytophthora fragariaefolia TaxID=1490495 RepID=A0A9W7CJM5_9STRA|nr:unnamed protein product [Phytophthora fragariaefolia]